MLASGWKLFLISCASVLIFAAEARAAEWLNFYPVSGDLSFGVDSRWTRNDSGDELNKIELEERLRLRLGGYSLDPQIFTFNIKLEPALEQEETDSGNQTFTSDSQYLNYGARFSFLHGVQASPVSLRANFAMNTAETEGSLGSRSESTVGIRGTDLLWKFTPFPSTFSYSEQSLEDIFYPGFGLPPKRRDQVERTLAYRGESRGMKLYLENKDFDDRTELDQDYASQKARLENRFRWGKNSSFTSRMEYFDRQGFNSEERISVNESLHLQHTPNLATQYGYGYESLNRTTDTETHNGSFGLNHRLYSNLDTRLAIVGKTTESEQFQEDSYNTSLDFNYRKQIRPALRISANLGGGYGVTDRSGGQLDFTESPSVPATGIVVLAQRFIVTATIVVTAPGCNPCVVGSDYLVEDAGGDLTQLRIPAGSRISIGDTITVDYAYQPPTVEFSSIPYRVGVRLQYGPFAFYHRTAGEEQTYVSGPDPGAVGDRRTDTTGVEWNRSWGRSRASLSMERIYSKMIGRTTTEYRLRQSLNYALAANATMNANFSQSFLRNNTDADSYTGDLSVRWVPSRGLSVMPRLSAFRRVVDPGVSENFVKAGVDMRQNWRRLSAEIRYDHILRETDGFRSVEDRIFFELTRKF